MATLGWGIIGIGNIVQGTMAPGMLEEPECEIVAAVSRDRGRADAFAGTFQVPYAYTDYAEMLANDRVEAVFIATPNSQHADQVVAAAQAGKHVFCDKPLAINTDDAVRAIRACNDADVKLGINFHNRRLPWVNDVRDIIRQGRIGDVLTVQVEASAGLRPPADWRNDPTLAGLGTTYSQGVHVFDFLRYILDASPVEVATIFDDQGEHQVETQSMSLFRFDNGTRAYCNINQSIPYPQNDIDIYGTQGRIAGVGLTRSRSDGELRVLDEHGETAVAYTQPSGLAHRQNIAAFTRAILNGDEPNASGIDGLHSTILCDAMRRSVVERKVVEVDYESVLSRLA